MASLETPVCDFGWKAVDFNLQGVDGKRYDLSSAKGENGLLVMFICNHCPYVKAVQDRIIRDVNELKQHGINAIAIMSNDPADYPEDSFENMALIAKQLNYPFTHCACCSDSVISSPIAAAGRIFCSAVSKAIWAAISASVKKLPSDFICRPTCK